MTSCAACGAGIEAEDRFCADEAAALLKEARTMFRRLRAEPWLERIDRALAPTAA